MRRRFELRVRVFYGCILADTDDASGGFEDRYRYLYKTRSICVRPKTTNKNAIIYPPTLQTFLSVFIGIVAVVALMINPPLHLVHHGIERPPDTRTIVCVPGRGFSGFWYAFGMLQSISSTNNNTSTTEDVGDNEYYCYSSGCLCAALSLANKTYDEVLSAAVEAQNLWSEGMISRYDIVPHFINSILDDVNTDETIFQKLNVLLTTKGTGVTAKRPQTAQELRELLIQTTWIPFITGSALWIQDTSIGQYHMDGAFSSTLHPPCDRRIDVPCTFDIMRNVLNPFLDQVGAKSYYEQGIRYGLSYNNV